MASHVWHFLIVITLSRLGTTAGSVRGAHKLQRKNRGKKRKTQGRLYLTERQHFANYTTAPSTKAQPRCRLGFFTLLRNLARSRASGGEWLWNPRMYVLRTYKLRVLSLQKTEAAVIFKEFKKAPKYKTSILNANYDSCQCDSFTSTLDRQLDKFSCHPNTQFTLQSLLPHWPALHLRSEAPWKPGNPEAANTVKSINQPAHSRATPDPSQASKQRLHRHIFLYRSPGTKLKLYTLDIHQQMSTAEKAGGEKLPGFICSVRGPIRRASFPFLPPHWRARPLVHRMCAA